MNHFKSVLLSLLLGFISLGANAKTVSVFACEPEWAALTQQIAGNRAKIYTATTAFEDPHHVRARPSHLAAIRRADLVFCTGSDLEAGWLPLLLKKGSSGVQPNSAGYLMAADWVTRIEVPATLDRSQGDIHAQGNPHVHLDPRNLVPISKQLTQRLALLDPENAATYRARQVKFEKDWRAHIAKWQSQAAPLKGKNIAAHHRSFSYLFDWLGVQTVVTLEPKPGVSPSVSDLKSAATALRNDGAFAIVRTPYEPKKAADWAAKFSGKPVVVLPYTVGGSKQASNLKGLFDLTLARLLKANP